MGGRRLEINNARLDDTAPYSCQATNAAGSVDKDIYLQVHGQCWVTHSDNFGCFIACFAEAF